VASLTVYLFLIGWSIYRLVRKPKDPWAFSILLFLFTIALFSNIAFLVYSQFAERFLFFASAGFCLALALAYEWWIGRAHANDVSIVTSKRSLVVVLPVCLLFFALTIVRNSEWKDNYTLFSSDLKKAPDNSKLNFYLATTISQTLYPEDQNPDRKLEMDKESIGLLQRSINIYPDFGEAHAEIGRIYDRLHLFDSAIVHDTKAVVLNPANAIATYNLARAYYWQKNLPLAIQWFKKAVMLSPGYALAYLNLAKCYADNKEYDSAIVYFNKTLAIDPAQTIAQQGIMYAMKKKTEVDTTGK
jgi:tetratricopeptide (TPR) repeat protein